MNPEQLVGMEETISEAREGFKINRFINLKIGGNKTPGYSIIDKDSNDIKHDIEDFPYPLKDQTCESVLINHQIAKIKPWLQIEAMNEFHRLLVVGGILLINTPYGLNDLFIEDPENISSWNDRTPLYFCPDLPPFLSASGQSCTNFGFNKNSKPWELVKLEWNRHHDMKVGMKKL